MNQHKPAKIIFESMYLESVQSFITDILLAVELFL